mmetsp:Transcript_18963/g.39980  ORF Transcript_18963/g.39980 Transcript_18963/m.39980 type:complete len:380 (-) Transcript_18963:301-1440(-)|eukprot:CAMPEP_0183720658 /NCGR_PEP_ID=MMETSP0737-20130205/13208_1 /TAXON_ID=385413 /ORGANISM="Thalassiosira miniscula, Strain CCMP1093" /LENGTH=379 /DNA_ID=CAMNT_0025950551 /DNA_START=53 /DNA_END=1192 /DNA_ORIENTATION=+
MDSSDQSSESPPLPSPAAEAAEAAAERELTISVSEDGTKTADRNTPIPGKSSRKKSVSRSRRETIVLIFVVIFILNSINGQKLIKSVNQQFEDWGVEYYSTPTAQNIQQPENNTEDTAIIISSSWIPTLPSTYMVDSVFNSTDRLLGLSPTAPVFITIDHFRFRDFANLPPALKERIDSLEEYQVNLFNTYLSNPRVHIIPASKNLHIGGSVVKALNLIGRHFPSVRYVYYLQHDFHFFKDVDHTALVNVMDEYPKINYIRFPKRHPSAISRNCGDEQPIRYNSTILNVLDDGSTAPRTLTLHPTSAYSDNNHLVRFDWYIEVIKSLIKLDRAPEDPLQRRANNGCWHNPPQNDDITGLYLYFEQNIAHLDGRHSTNVP